MMSIFPEHVRNFISNSLEILSALFIVVVGLAVLFAVLLYIRDKFQTASTIRRNYPLIGRFRYIFEHLGEFFRQYFFAQDREEMPFNRAQRNWIYRAAKDIDSTIAFGSTKNTRTTGSVLFVNCPYPTLKEDAVPPGALTIGPFCNHPYTTSSIFNISGMSYGAISTPAVRALSKGAYLAGCWLNTGEGGLSPYHLEGGCDVVFQIGTAKYGVRDSKGKLNDEKLREVAAHDQLKMFELKLSQGAKPGKGGILPGGKVTPEIAKIRGIAEGGDSISPNRHPEINSSHDLLGLINHIRTVTGKPTGFKAVMGSTDWLEELCETIRSQGVESAPDFITVDSSDGGTGAAPMSLMDDVGLPLRESLALVIDMLKVHELRERIKVIASGKCVTPTEVAWALCVGADFVVSARGFMFALGCIQALQCNKNTCPTGITTHNKKLQRGLIPEDKAQRVTAYHKNIMHEVGVIAHSCGVKTERNLKRKHARIVMDTGISIPLNELYPEGPILGAKEQY